MSCHGLCERTKRQAANYLERRQTVSQPSCTEALEMSKQRCKTPSRRACYACGLRAVLNVAHTRGSHRDAAAKTAYACEATLERLRDCITLELWHSVSDRCPESATVAPAPHLRTPPCLPSWHRCRRSALRARAPLARADWCALQARCGYVTGATCLFCLARAVPVRFRGRSCRGSRMHEAKRFKAATKTDVQQGVARVLRFLSKMTV